MAARKTKTDINAMSAEEKAKYDAARAPRPAYIAYTVNEDQTISIALVTRSAEEVLAAVDGNRELKYTRTLIK